MFTNEGTLRCTLTPCRTASTAPSRYNPGAALCSLNTAVAMPLSPNPTPNPNQHARVRVLSAHSNLGIPEFDLQHMLTIGLFLAAGLASIAAAAHLNSNTATCSALDDPCCPDLSAAPADTARAATVCGGRPELHSPSTLIPTPPLPPPVSATPPLTPCKTGTSGDRARCLVAQMTLDEKIGVGVPRTVRCCPACPALSTVIDVPPALVPLQLVHGTGWGNSVYVGLAQGVPRLNIPDLTLNDGPQGCRCNGLSKCPPGTSTAFPSIGASFDAGAAEARGRAMGAEFYEKGANVQLGPGLCITRTRGVAVRTCAPLASTPVHPSRLPASPCSSLTRRLILFGHRAPCSVRRNGPRPQATLRA